MITPVAFAFAFRYNSQVAQLLVQMDGASNEQALDAVLEQAEWVLILVWE
jgi:hypothetical protein